MIVLVLQTPGGTFCPDMWVDDAIPPESARRWAAEVERAHFLQPGSLRLVWRDRDPRRGPLLARPEPRAV